MQGGRGVEQYSNFDAMAYVKEMSTARTVVNCPVWIRVNPGTDCRIPGSEGWGKEIERTLRVK